MRSEREATKVVTTMMILMLRTIGMIKMKQDQ